MANQLPIFDILRYKVEGNIFADMLDLKNEVEYLRKENTEMKSMLLKSMQQMQEIYLELLRERSNRSETNVPK